LLICKTRTETIFKQGMRNRVLNFGAVFMLVIVALISYVPGFKDVWGTRPMNILYWFVGVPYFIVIVVYDETRKLMIRNKPRGWVYRNTYY